MAAQTHAAFMSLLSNLIDGHQDAGAYEDACRALLGAPGPCFCVLFSYGVQHAERWSGQGDKAAQHGRMQAEVVEAFLSLLDEVLLLTCSLVIRGFGLASLGAGQLAFVQSPFKQTQATLQVLSWVPVQAPTTTCCSR